MLFIIFGIVTGYKIDDAKVSPFGEVVVKDLCSQTVQTQFPLGNDATRAFLLVSEEESESETEFENPFKRNFHGILHGASFTNDSARNDLFKTLKQVYQNNHFFNLLVRFCVFLI